MVLSSDKISGLRKPLLMLKLQTLTPDNKQEESLVEMDAEELAKLLKSLKAAQKVSPHASLSIFKENFTQQSLFQIAHM